MDENSILLSLLLIVILWEVVFPSQQGIQMVSARRFGNISLLPLNLLVSSLLQPQLLVLISLMYLDLKIGLLSPLGGYPLLYSVVAFVVLDLSMYVQHRLLHWQGFLWSLHSLHHSDTRVDFTTYFRHHPLETVTSSAMTLCFVAIAGITPVALATYLIVNNAMQLFQHSNIQLPRMLSWIEILFVTPAFHARHHSIVPKIADSNYATIFTIWDILFGTYSKKNADKMTFGVTGFEDEMSQSISTMLSMPFLSFRRKK